MQSELEETIGRLDLKQLRSVKKAVNENIKKAEEKIIKAKLEKLQEDYSSEIYNMHRDEFSGRWVVQIIMPVIEKGANYRDIWYRKSSALSSEIWGLHSECGISFNGVLIEPTKCSMAHTLKIRGAR